MTKKLKNNKVFLIFILIGLLLRIYLSRYYTHYGDLLTFKAWGITIQNSGFRNFYSVTWSDYLPGYLYITYLLTQISTYLASLNFHLSDEFLYKLPSILTDIGTSIYIYLIVKKFTSPKKALITSIFSLFNPAILANSTLWGQVDSFITFFLLSSFYYLLEGKLILSALLIGLAQSIKPIAIFSLPVYLIYLYFKKNKLKDFIKYLFTAGVTIIVTFLPFNNTQNPAMFIIDRHLITSSQYPYTSLNAFNLWSIITNFWVKDDKYFLLFTYHTLGNILFGMFYIFLLLLLKERLSKVKNEPFFLSSILFLIYGSMFMFLTRMHERHLFYAIIYSLLLLPISNIFVKIAILSMNLIYFLNLYFAYSQINYKPAPFNNFWVVFFSTVNLVLLIYLIINFITSYADTNKAQHQ